MNHPALGNTPDDDGAALVAIFELIKADIDAGRADETTIQMWNGIRDTMAAAFDDLRLRLVGVPEGDRERIKRDWYEEFLALHWPSTKASRGTGVGG